MDNGERYVGQAVDVVRRFTAHRRRWADIVAIQFSPHPTGDLDPLERDAIHRQQTGHPLRNKAFAIGPAGPSPLDMAVTPSQQDACLAADDNELAGVELGDGIRTVTDSARDAGRAAYSRLMSRPNATTAVELLSAFVHSVLPRPRETEGRFWGVSAAPSTGSSAHWRRLAAVSVHSMETFVIGETPQLGREEDWVLRGFVVVSRSELEASCGVEVDSLAADFAPVLSFLRRSYESAGDDDLAVHWVGTQESVAALDELPWIPAARLLAIRLMRKGLSLQRRWHNVPLADAVFGDEVLPR